MIRFLTDFIIDSPELDTYIKEPSVFHLRSAPTSSKINYKWSKFDENNGSIWNYKFVIQNVN